MVSWADAQTSVLGSVLIEPGLAPKLLAETSAADFSGVHLVAYQAIAALVAEGTPVDITSVCDKLSPEYKQIAIDMMMCTPTAANFNCYVDIVKKQSRLTALQEFGSDLMYSTSLEDARSLLSRAQDLVTDTSNKRIFTMKQMLMGFFDAHQDTKKEYITWGIDALNDNTQGLLRLDFNGDTQTFSEM